jgi:hypothetical protein
MNRSIAIDLDAAAGNRPDGAGARAVLGLAIRGLLLRRP